MLDTPQLGSYMIAMEGVLEDTSHEVEEGSCGGLAATVPAGGVWPAPRIRFSACSRRSLDRVRASFCTTGWYRLPGNVMRCVAGSAICRNISTSSDGQACFVTSRMLHGRRASRGSNATSWLRTRWRSFRCQDTRVAEFARFLVESNSELELHARLSIGPTSFCWTSQLQGSTRRNVR